MSTTAPGGPRRPDAGPTHTTAGVGRPYEPAPAPFLARQPAYPWFVVGTVCIGAFMGQLDASIAQLVLPTLETAFHERLSAVGWVALAYLLTLAIALPVFGRLADMFGRKLLYITGFVVFIAGSALCGFAPTLDFLIVTRVFQAIGAALLQANSVAIITAAVGSEHRGRALGIQGAAQAIGLSTGPAVGGLLIQTLGWQWVFWINVPAGLAGAVLGWFILPCTRLPRSDRRFDWPGALLLAPALLLLLLALSEGRTWGFASALFLACLLGGLAFLAGFIWHEHASASPLIDLTLFRAPAFAAGNLAGLLSYAVLFGIFFLLPFAAERGHGVSPLMAGLFLTSVPVALGVVAPLSGGLSDRAGPRLLTAGGMALACGALLLLAHNIYVAAPVALTATLLLFGVGQGLFTAPNNSAIMGAAPAERLGVAGGVLNLMRSLGTSLGVAFATTLLSWRIAAQVGHYESTARASPHVLVNGVHDTLIFFAVLALIAAGVSLARGQTTVPPSPPAAEAAHRP